MKRNKSVLREDLASLLKKYASSDVVATMARQYAQVKSQTLPIVQIVDNHYLSHLTISPHELEKTLTSLSSQLDVAPLIVRPTSDKFEIVLGRRRFYASLRLGHQHLPVIVQSFTDVEMILTIIANLRESRESNALSIATLAQVLYTEFGYSHAALASVSHMSRSTMTNLLRLLRLPIKIQRLLTEGKISYGHARCLINVSSVIQDKLIEDIVKKKLSVRMTETAVALVKEHGYDNVETLFNQTDHGKIIVKKKSVTFTFDDQQKLAKFLKRLHEQKIL